VEQVADADRRRLHFRSVHGERRLGRSIEHLGRRDRERRFDAAAGCDLADQRDRSDLAGWFGPVSTGQHFDDISGHDRGADHNKRRSGGIPGHDDGERHTDPLSGDDGRSRRFVGSGDRVSEQLSDHRDAGAITEPPQNGLFS
jgi:hypothetical protein